MTLARGAAASAAIAIVLAVGSAHVQAQAPQPAAPVAPVAAVAPVAPQPNCFGAAARDPLHPCSNHALRLMVVPKPVAAKTEENAPCNGFHRENGVSVCTFGVLPAQATRTVALVGDSHASHWRAPLDIIAHEQGWRGLSVTRQSCPYSKATKRTPEPTRSRCLRWVKALPGFFRAHPEIDTAFVVGLAGGKVVIPPGRTLREAEINGFRNAWDALPDTVRHIVVIRDTPRIAVSTVECVDHAISAHHPAGVPCARPRRQALGSDPQTAAARDARSPRLQVIDLSSILCSRRACFPVIGGALVYKDLHHLSRVFAETLSGPLGREVRRAMESW
jgi:hypothetical protein